jgi:hypothetical protein
MYSVIPDVCCTEFYLNGKKCKNVWAAVCSRPSVRHVFRAADFYGTRIFSMTFGAHVLHQISHISVEKRGVYLKKFIYILKYIYTLNKPIYIEIQLCSIVCHIQNLCVEFREDLRNSVIYETLSQKNRRNGVCGLCIISLYFVKKSPVSKESHQLASPRCSINAHRYDKIN